MTQSSDGGRRYRRIKEIALAVRRREGLHTALKAAAEAWAGGPVILVLLFLASVAYVVLGGSYEAESSPEAAISTSATTPQAADAGGAARKQPTPGSSTAAIDDSPAAYVNRGRDGDGNVMTYEHD